VISRDGHSNWLEGLQLIGVYVIVALAAFFL
jgi:Ca2+/H+ antiporter